MSLRSAAPWSAQDESSPERSKEQECISDAARCCTTLKSIKTCSHCNIAESSLFNYQIVRGKKEFWLHCVCSVF